MTTAIYIAISLAFYSLLACLASKLLGGWNYPFVWAVFGIQCAAGLIGICILDPELLSERLKPKGKDRDPWGRIVISILFLAQFVLACYDISAWHLSDSIPAWLQGFALLPFTIGWYGIIWAMKVNRFFSSAIRLQEDRGQHLIDSGPYRFIRHPGYAFASLSFISGAVAMGSLLSLIPQVIIIFYLLYRTGLEESLLEKELAGYAEYKTRVRFRWIPGIW